MTKITAENQSRSKLATVRSITSAASSRTHRIHEAIQNSKLLNEDSDSRSSNSNEDIEDVLEIEMDNCLTKIYANDNFIQLR